MTGCSVSGHRPGSHLGLSLEPFSGGKPPLPSGRTCSQQVEAPPSTGRQVSFPLLLGALSPSPPQETETTAARPARRAIVQVARCCTLLSPQRRRPAPRTVRGLPTGLPLNIPRSRPGGSLRPPARLCTESRAGPPSRSHSSGGRTSTAAQRSLARIVH